MFSRTTGGERWARAIHYTAIAPRRRQGMIYLLDTGPLVSALAREEPQFGSWAKDLLRRLPRPLYTCEAVLTEAAHFLGNPEPVLAALADGLVVCPWDLTEHHARVREFMPISRSIWPTPAWSR